MSDAALPWLSLFALGAAHGVNPAMGWLFAVGRGLQARDRRALWRAFGPLALGHALAIAVAVIAAATLGGALPARWVRWVVALGLFAVGVDGLRRHRHVRLGGMRVSGRELAAWSFLTATAHGAGLMVLPFVLGAEAPSAHQHHPAFGGGTQAAGAVAPVVHTLGYLAATVVLAVVVYEKVGVRVLRRAWVNVNAVWAVALIVAAVAAAVG